MAECSSSASVSIPRLAERERDIAVFNHVLDLSTHRQCKKDKPVDDQHRPEDREIEYLKPTANEADCHGSRR